jgi:hypothetical protein
VDPLLAALGNNGGPTFTMALLPGSPAIDAGGNTPVIDPATGLPLTTDQRGAGFARIVGGGVDVGAFEVQSLTPVAASMTAPGVTFGHDGLVTVAVAPSNATGALSLFVDGGSIAVGTHALSAGDNGSSTFDTGILNAGIHGLHAVYAATGVFLSSTADGSLFVSKADATVNVSVYSGKYDSSAHGATGTVTGVGSDSGAAGSSLDLGASFTNAPGGTAHWVFSGGTNYNDQKGDVNVAISKANAIVKVSGYSGTYDGKAHGAAGTVIGVGSDNGAAGSSLNVGASFKNVPGGTAHWVFNGGMNYNDQSGNVSITIGAKAITGSVTANNKVYDGTTAATIKGTFLAGVIAGDNVTLTVGAANFASKHVGTWTVTATGLGLSGTASGNYVLASKTALTTASIRARSLDAVLSTASTINIAKDGSLTFTFSKLSGDVDRQNVADLFKGVQFSLVIGATLYTGKCTVSVGDGTIRVSWRMDQQLYTDLHALLNGATPSAKTTIDLRVCATSSDGKYTLNADVHTKIFQQGSVSFPDDAAKTKRSPSFHD